MTKVLIIEDVELQAITLRDSITRLLGYKAVVASDGEDGYKKAVKIKPNLILLDVNLPKYNGFTVCKDIRQSDTVKNTPIIMLTGYETRKEDIDEGYNMGADAYILKPYNLTDLMDLIKTILNRPDLPYIQKDKISKIDFHCQQYGSAEKSSGIPPFPYNKDVVKVGIYCQPKQQILFNSEETHVSEKILAIDQDFCEVAVNVLNDDRWRERTKYHGEDLYRKLIIDHPEILRAYTEHKSNRKDSDVRLCFQSDLDFFRIPFEFLYDRYGPDRFLVTTHPLSRRVLMNASYKKRAPSPDLFNQFWRQKRTLKVLIIASGADESGCNDEPSLEHVDEEVVTIRKVIEERLITKNIKHKVDHILSKDSDYETVRNLLKTCEYHILHYAGHAFFSERFPEKSYLLFKSGKCGGNPERMSAVALRRLLSDSELKFVYLSCCMGGESTWKYKLNDNQSTGLAVAIAQAGIPSVLGYRGNVNDNSARELAVSFYRSLFDQGSLDKALFDARNEMMEKYADDPIWLSPMLVIQRSG